MTEIPVNVATNIAQKLVDGVINETRYLCCFRNIANDYENEKKKLMIKQKSVEDDVKEAKDKNEEIVIDVMEWQSKANNMIEEDTKAKKSCFFRLLPNCIWFYRRGKDLESKAQEIKNLIESCKFNKISRPIGLPGVEYYSSEDFIQFESRNLAQKQLHEALKNDENYMVGLHGTGGSGKTKLVKQVGNEVQKSKLFDKVIFVVVSNPAIVHKIQDDIASVLALPLNENESERPKRLWSRLRNGQKILIILDDVWEKLNFEDIGIPSRNNHEGCRVLLTTRDSDICNSMGCQKMIPLELLPPKDAWILFKKFANISDNSPPTLKDVAQKITFECKGLPVAITAMASTLKGHHLEDWRAALKTLQSSKPIDYIHENLKHVYNCLRVSYDNLKNQKAKDLFLLCSTFPEDHKIHIEELIRYAIGTGLFGELNSYQTARSQVRLAKHVLMGTCLLLKAEDERCIKMHDLVHEVARLIANNEIHEIMEPKRTLKALQEDTVVGQKVRYLHWHNMNDFSHKLDLPNLEILILVCNSEYGVSVAIPDAFFDGMKGIRVLNLKADCSWGVKIRLMPRSIEVLKNLRTLDLRNCILSDISVLGNLQRIETLELYYCSINELPNGIVELNKLRLFRLESCEIKGNPYQVIGRFSKIEELYFLKNSISNGKVDSGVVADLFDKNKISPALERYHIEVGVNNGVLAEYLNDSISRALSFEHFDVSISNATIKDLMRRAETLCLDKFEGGCKSILPDFFNAIGEDMTELVKLGLYDCSEIEYLIDTSKVSSSLGSPSNLENLEQLTIMGCGQLKNSGLFVGNLNQRALRELCVESCPKLTYLFTVSIAQSLVLLEGLIIKSCDAMECIIKDESKEIVVVDHDQRNSLLSMFPKLQRICITRCGQLECFLSGGSYSHKEKTTDFPISSIDSVLKESNLKPLPPFDTIQYLLNQLFLFYNIREMRLTNCPQLKSVFTFSDTKTMQLEELSIDRCEGLKNIITTVVGDDDANYSCILPKLRHLEVIDCKQLEHVFGECHQNHISKLKIDIHVPALEHLDLFGLSNMVSICSTGYLKSNTELMLHSEQTATQILEMWVINCPRLKWVFTPSDTITMQLKQLYIEECEGLKNIITAVVGDDDANYSCILLPKLRYLSVHDCKELVHVFGECHQNHTSKLKIDIHVPALQYLHLEGLLNMVSICSTGYYPTSPSLKSNTELMLHSQQTATQILKMSVINCPRLKSVFTLSDTITMQLEQLIIRECEGLKNIITIVVGDDDANYSCILPKLRRLDIRDCKQLEYVFGECHQNHTSKLKIDIHVPALEHLDLSGLPNMVSICSTGYLKSNSELMLHSQQTATQGLEASNSEWLFPFGTAQCLLKQYLILSNIKEIRLQDCPQLISVFTMSNVTTMALEELNIINCDGLKHIITVGEDNNNQMSNSCTLQKLKRVYISHCKQLECMFGKIPQKDNLSYQNHPSNLVIHIHLPTLEELNLQNLPSMISICTEKYHATCPSLKKFNYENCPKFAKPSIVEFIENSDTKQLKCNDTESEELLKFYRQELEAEKQKFSQNVSPNGTESIEKKSVLQKIPESEKEEIPTSSLVNSEPRNSQSINQTLEESVPEDSESEKQIAEASSTGSKLTGIEETMRQSIQEIPTSKKEKIATSLIHSKSRNTQSIKGSFQEDSSGEGPSESWNSMSDPFLTSLPKTTLQSIADEVKQSVQEGRISEKSTMATSLTDCALRTLPLELMEYEEVDFLFKIDSRRALLLDNAFVKYPHLWDWQKSHPPRFCKWGYKSLSDMLMFLKEKTAEAMNESSKEEFEKLYAELVSFGFDSDWLATIHQRVMDLQADNEKLKYLVELELRESILVEELNNVRAEIVRIKDDISKSKSVFNF